MHTHMHPHTSPRISSSRPRLSRRMRTMLSIVLISAGLYAVGVASSVHSETDEGRVFGSCVWLLPGVDACRDDDGTLTIGDGLGADGLPLVWVEGLLA